MLGQVFTRFMEKSPVSVIVRGLLERALNPAVLDAWYERVSDKQYTRTLLFSTVYDLLSQVVFKIKPSVHAAYQEKEEEMGAPISCAKPALSLLRATMAEPNSDHRHGLAEYLP